MKSDLSLVVEEPIPGHYYWMIIRTGWLRLTPALIKSSPGPLPSYASALIAGSDVLATLQAPDGRPRPGGIGGAWDVMTMPGALI